jgi:hypothetical protein
LFVEFAVGVPNKIPRSISLTFGFVHQQPQYTTSAHFISYTYPVGSAGPFDFPDSMRTGLHRQFINGIAQTVEILPAYPVLQFLKIAICGGGYFYPITL